MSIRLSPVAILSIAAIAGLGLVAAVTALALGQPWLGLGLAPEQGVVRIVSVTAGGPAAEVPAPAALIALSGSGDRVELAPVDVIEEPDALATDAEVDDFLDRQSRLAAMLKQGEAGVEWQAEDGARAVTAVRPGAGRPIGDLPPVFWVQIVTGLAGFLIGAWVWSLRRAEIGAGLFALAGLGLMVSAFPAAVYSTRELALDGGLFRVLTGFNQGGAFIFGAAMIALFLAYPRRLVRPVWLGAPALVLALWLTADLMDMLSGPPIGIHLPVTLAMAAIVVCVGLQYRATRADPAARAALSWLALAVVLGAGAFVLTIIAPNLLGVQPALSQGYAFALFLVIYAGLALGVARYRLFDLEEWAFRILFYLFGAILLVALDAALILAVSFERGPAFGLSLLAVAFLYLPLRGALAERFLVRQAAKREDLFRRVMDVALAPSGADREEGWLTLLRDVFNPLRVERHAAGPGSAALGEDGLTLLVPGAEAVPPLMLEHANGGRRLFSARDAALAGELHAMLRHALESRAASEKGAARERERIAVDIHDNIGVQLLGALHSQASERKDALIREALSDLRDIINNASRPGLSFDETLADLRVEIAEHLTSAGIGLDWSVTARETPVLAPQAAHALRSVIREATGNVIKHAGASRLTVRIGHDAGIVCVEIADDGMGFDPGVVSPGNGLTNMRTRIAALDGTFEVAADGSGTRLAVRFPSAARTPPGDPP